MKILHDVIDVCMMRFKPLAAYDYPLWQVLALLGGISLAISPMAMLLHTDVLSRALFIFCMKLAQYAVMARFFRVWLQLKLGEKKLPLSNWDGQGKLLTILIMVQGVDFLNPLLLWTDGDVRAWLSLLLFAYSVTLVIRGLARTTGASVPVVIGGLVLCAPMLVMVALVFGMMAIGWGWINPQDFQIPADAAATAAAAVPAPPAP